MTSHIWILPGNVAIDYNLAVRFGKLPVLLLFRTLFLLLFRIIGSSCHIPRWEGIFSWLLAITVVLVVADTLEAVLVADALAAAEPHVPHVPHAVPVVAGCWPR